MRGLVARRFTSYPGLRLTGSLERCLYTGVVDSQLTPSGGYIETGPEMFVGSLNGGATDAATMWVAITAIGVGIGYLIRTSH